MINNKIIYSIVMLLMGVQIQAQVVLSDKNYVHTTVPQTAVTIAEMHNVNCSNIKDVDNTIESVTYYDGLGRPIQQRAIKASPDGNDIITHIEYDNYGRQAKQYLPFEATNTTGSYKIIDINTDINAYYKNTYPDDFLGIDINHIDFNAYSESVFEASPLNRVTEQGAPGKAWKADSISDMDHTIKFDWDTNASNEVVYFKVGFPDNYNTHIPTLVKDGHYAPNQLYVTITKDENWTPTDGDLHTTKEYKDKQGRVVLKRIYASTPSGTSEAHDTYYVYDLYDNLTYVIPPKVTTIDGVSTTELKELCYQYTYDYKNRLIEKKIPGKGWEYIVYNKKDQPILTQDTILKQNNKWLFTKYDTFGRVAYTGIRLSGAIRSVLQDTWANKDTYVQYETSATTPFTFSNTQVYYSKSNAYPTSFDKIYTINYYDDYRFLVNEDAIFDNPGTVLGQTIRSDVKTLPTATKTQVLDTNPIKWITTVTYYDQKSRPIYVVSKNEFLNTVDVTETKYDFIGKVEKTKTTHTKGSNAPIVTVDKFTYDHMGRLLTQTQQINTQDTEQIVSNTYDALGQLTQKDVGSTSTPLIAGDGTLSVVEGLQTIDYTYNIRGWLKTINEGTTANGDLFGFKIDYNEGTNPLYNGNISRTSWQTANDNINRSYNYTYDALNRIITGISNDGNYNVSNISYDKMGNILSLNRTGHLNEAATSFGVMDNLGYTYDTGNKLLKVTDTTNKSFGFKDGTNTNDDFTYDDNGNMIIDRNKGITGITYNHLNLPKKVTINNAQGTGNISYIYDATGVKLKKIAPSGSSLIETEYAGNYIYKNGSLQYFSTPEGYATTNGSSYRYVYQFKDHSGNIRLSYTKSETNGDLEIIEENNYYPFGLKHKGYNSSISSLGNSTAQLLRFGGKEEQNELGLGWIDITARNYDPALGRWMNIDPLADQFTEWSTYNFVKNSPNMYIDPTGLAPETIYKKIGTNETVEVNDGVDKTVEVSESDFYMAELFAILINQVDSEGNYTKESKAVTEEVADAYNSFFESNNSFGELNTSNAISYLFDRPKLKVYHTSLGAAPPIFEWVSTGGSSKGIGLAFKAFTKANYRHNLKVLTQALGIGDDAHHLFVQKYETFFKSKNINIHHPEYVRWWKSSPHRKASSAINKEWGDWIATKGINATRKQVIEKGHQIANKYGL
ncbi:DUF6443 domain-containing protein [Aquimarina algiphila]|uniref:DUF6443 domain-containing protein n=1 Tax=Aquimarina algiphila TaxID=2047982 RepID=UPI00232E3577|nr:DUF6443 domain-containing protein [Aquimarina algiphila]